MYQYTLAGVLWTGLCGIWRRSWLLPNVTPKQLEIIQWDTQEFIIENKISLNHWHTLNAKWGLFMWIHQSIATQLQTGLASELWVCPFVTKELSSACVKSLNLKQWWSLFSSIAIQLQTVNQLSQLSVNPSLPSAMYWVKILKTSRKFLIFSQSQGFCSAVEKFRECQFITAACLKPSASCPSCPASGARHIYSVTTITMQQSAPSCGTAMSVQMCICISMDVLPCLRERSSSRAKVCPKNRDNSVWLSNMEA